MGSHYPHYEVRSRSRAQATAAGPWLLGLGLALFELSLALWMWGRATRGYAPPIGLRPQPRNSLRLMARPTAGNTLRPRTTKGPAVLPRKLFA